MRQTASPSVFVTDWAQQFQGCDLKPAMDCERQEGEVYKLDQRSVEARYQLSVDAVLSPVDPGSSVKAAMVLASYSAGKCQNQDIQRQSAACCRSFEARRQRIMQSIAGNRRLHPLRSATTRTSVAL